MSDSQDNVFDQNPTYSDSDIINESDLPSDDLLKVYQAGELTVVGFGGIDLPDSANLANYRDQLADLVQKHQCKTLAFDLTGVRLIPSGMLGLLNSLKNMGLEIELYNPSDDVQEVLEITQLHKVFQIRHIET